MSNVIIIHKEKISYIPFVLNNTDKEIESEILIIKSADKIEPLIVFDKKEYELQFSSITIFFKDWKATHMMMGFFCDGYPRVYDSQYNVFLDLDWTNVETKSKELYLSKYFRTEIQNFTNLFLIYINKNKIKDLRENPPDCFSF